MSNTSILEKLALETGTIAGDANEEQDLEVAVANVVALPLFVGLTMAHISVINTAQQAQQVLPMLLACEVLGFDTESQPTFIKGQKSTGPHLIQFATTSHAYLFPLVHADAAIAEVTQILTAPKVLKVGFGLRNDLRALQNKYSLHCAPTVDLARALRQGKKPEVGAKTGVARILQAHLHKPKSVTTSNWARAQLSPQQILYAANDAYAALMVYQRWLELS